MRIGVLSTVYHRTPPEGYGGISRVVHYLAEELVALGHDVTLFATPGSRTSGRLVEVKAYRPELERSGIYKRSQALSEEPVYEALAAYLERHPLDVIHDWTFQNLFVTRHPERVPFVVSLCVPGQFPGASQVNRVACSKALAEFFGGTTRYVVYGVPLGRYRFEERKKAHFVHLAKIARYKAQHEAILAARRVGARLFLVGNVEKKSYYYTRVRPLLALSPDVRFVGETKDPGAWMRDARALIQTPRFLDALPLATLESLASGTPVIAYDAGGVKEAVKTGITGFLAEDVDGLAAAMERIDEIDPRTCRDYAATYLSAERMARDYVALYERAAAGETW